MIMGNYLYMLFLGLAVAVVLAQGWLFYFAPCATVREYWTIVQAPARCINL